MKKFALLALFFAICNADVNNGENGVFNNGVGIRANFNEPLKIEPKFQTKQVFKSDEYSNQNIADSLRSASAKSNIDKRVLYTIAKIESGFKPLTISFTSYSKDFSYPNLKRKVGKYKDKYIISFSGKEDDLKPAVFDLISKGYNVDCGLMQINSVNFKKSEIDKIFKLDYNIAKSVKVLSSCINLKGKMSDSIECYNKGTRRFYTSYDYYKNFKYYYLKSFARI